MSVMNVDEALWTVEHLGPDLLPDAASVLAAEVRRLRALLVEDES